MDRNLPSLVGRRVQSVALRKESVDRNRAGICRNSARGLSLSARRAWIEIVLLPFAPIYCTVALRKESVDRNIWREVLELVQRVALRKESVDRNFGVAIVVTSCVKSLSARRAWIEILT